MNNDRLIPLVVFLCALVVAAIAIFFATQLDEARPRSGLEKEKSSYSDWP